MAKSTRSKVKRAFRAKKRTEGVFAAADAARLQRLNAKLRGLTTATNIAGEEGAGGRGREKARQSQEEEELQDVAMPAEDADADDEAVSPSTTEGVDGRTSEKPTGKISTHGPRGSRRERWRVSKGMTPRPKSRGMDRQGNVASRHKPGRSRRRR